MLENLAPKQKMQRVVANGRLSVKAGVGGTRLDKLFQEGAAKIRLPKTYDPAMEAVLINTAGGITGGDQITWGIEAKDQTRLVVTTQACEKIYRSSEGCAHVKSTIDVGEGCFVDWLPQETILFDEGALDRSLIVNLSDNARFMALEAVMLGRAAMGETVRTCHLKDRWRIFREERLIHADDIRISGKVDQSVNGSALLNDSAACASFVYCGPEDREQLQAIASNLKEIAQHLGIGVSVLDGKITARFLAANAYELRKTLVPFLEGAREKLGANATLPKVWNL